MIQNLLPAGVGTAEAYHDRVPAPLFPGEAELIARATDKRAREFATTRACARRALRRIGLPPVAVLRGAGRAPRWPDGVVGSLTHCDGYRAAAVAPATALAAVGIDAEPDLPLPDGVLRLVATAHDEQPMLAALAATDPAINWDRLMFCAKEAVYKAWSPLAGCWLGFLDVQAVLDPGGTFTAWIREPDPATPVARFTGRWSARGGLLLAAVAVPVRAAGARIAGQRLPVTTDAARS